MRRSVCDEAMTLSLRPCRATALAQAPEALAEAAGNALASPDPLKAILGFLSPLPRFRRLGRLLGDLSSRPAR
jgi:hypothetical protein